VTVRLFTSRTRRRWLPQPAYAGLILKAAVRRRDGDHLAYFDDAREDQDRQSAVTAV
jgi:hypothetical protein